MHQLTIVAAILLIMSSSTSAIAVIRSAGTTSSQNFSIPNISGWNLTGQGNIVGTDSVHTDSATAAPTPFSCSESVETASGQPFYHQQAPYELQSIAWTGAGNAGCTILMVSISFNLWAIDPQGVQHTIAANSCVECAFADALNTGYICTQDAVGGQCDGVWQISVEVVFQAPPEYLFTSGDCVLAGATATCSATVVAGIAPLFNPPAEAVVLPDGVALPVLDERAISDIRKTHFPGGSAVDPTKGLFNSGLTDADLGTIFQAGLQDSNTFVGPNTNFYYVKTFPYANVGIRSTSSGGGPATQVTLVISAYGDVITMYPE